MIMQQSRRQRMIPYALLALLCTALVLAVWQAGQPRGGLEWEPNAVVGLMPGVDLDARRRQLQQELDDSQIAFSMNTSLTFENGALPGKLMLENPQNNHKLLAAEVISDSTGETLYRSGAIRPGSYLEDITLNRALPAGSYPVSVVLYAYSEQTQELIGQTGASVTLTVLH